MRVEPRVSRVIAIGLILAFPTLVALQLTILALFGEGPLMYLVALLAWFGGPIVFVVGVVMLVPRVRWTLRPSTPTGRFSLWLDAAFAGWFVIFVAALASGLGPDSPQRFFDNLYLAIPLVLAGVIAVAAGMTGAYAIAFRRERSLLVIGVMVFGVVVAIFTAGEIGGHEDQGGAAGRRTVTPAPAGNSHTNVQAASVGTDQVRVSFDYAYDSDPQGATITAITVTPLGDNGEIFVGLEPVVRPITRGSGHMDVVVSFSPGQSSRVRAFSVCFTGDGEPDLGCVATVFQPN